MGSQPSDSGVLKLVRAKRAKDGQQGWRAYVLYYEDPSNKRIFGTWRPDRLAAVNKLLAKLEDDLTAAEISRVRLIAGKPAVKKGSKEQGASSKVGSQPSDGELCVPFVHQIYGIYRDGKPMPSLFVESERRWKQCAVNMGVPYHLWTADEVDTLMRTHYEDFWDMYKDARFPVMRCDIGRIAILHRFGGLYSDLDVWPNRFEYKHSEFAVCSVPAGNKANGKHQRGYLDMEVLIAGPGNPFLIDWLKHIKEQMEAIDYSEGAYVNRRMRYIYHTTGPRGMEHFIKLPANKEYAQTKISHIQCNRFCDYENLTQAQKQEYDVLTRTSNSYFTSEFRISKPVADKVTHVLPFPITHSKRIREKTSMHGAIVGGLTMATDLPSKRPRWRSPCVAELEASEHVKKLRARSNTIEHSLLALWDHLRELGRDPTWYHRFVATLDPQWKVEILTAWKIMEDQDARGEDLFRYLGADFSYDQVATKADWARSHYPDPVAALIGQTAPDRSVKHLTRP